VSNPYYRMPLTINKENSAFEHAVKLLVHPITIGIIITKAIIDQANWKK
jgi:hypothetical protein